MKQRLDARPAPKGLLTPTESAILAWLRAHGPATPEQVRTGLLASGGTSWLVLDQHQRFWASDRLFSLYQAGHLLRDKPQTGESVYRVAEPDDTGNAPAAPSVPVPVSVPAPARNVAAPRRVQVLRGPLLQGGDPPPVREGAMDFAAIPSLINGKRVYRRHG